MSTNRPNASIWDDDEGEAQLRPMMRKNNAHLFDDEPPVSSLSAASAASAAAAVAGYTASSAAEANAASALSAPSAYSVGSASSAFSARSAGSAHSAVSASSAAVPSAASAAAPEAANIAASAPTPDSAGSAPLSAHSGAPSAASAPAMPPSQAPKSAPSAPVNGPVLGTTPSVHVPASSLANNGVPAMLANTPPAAGRRYTNAENAHTSGTFDSAARRATATTAATSATASTGASALTAASAAAASVTAQSPASATSANAPELADAAKPAVADAGATNPGSGAVRRRSLFTAVPQPVPVDEDSDDETIQVPVVREDLIPDSFSAASAVSASAASASATSAAESASAAETVSAAETTSAAETSSSVSAASAPSSLEHSSAATSPASASDDVALESAAQADQVDQESVDSVQELNDAHEVEAAAVPLPTDFDAPSAISIPTPPHTVSSALSAESTFSIDSAVSAASAASSVGITLPSAATPAPAVPVTPAPAVPVTPAAGATDTASNELSKTTPAAAEPPAPPAPEQPEATSVEADFTDDELVASDHTETTIMDAADMELEEVVKPVVTSTSPVGVERLDHLATADSADLAPVAPSPSSAIFASTRTAAFSDSANQSDADNEVDDDVLLAGSTVVGKPASRAAAHWGGTLLALVLFPIAWFLMHTAANALTGALADGWPKVFSTAGIIELGMAIVLLIVVMATATRSSLGTFVTGITTLLIGLPFVVVPSITKQYLGDFLANMALQSRFGRILSEAILLDGVSGRLVIIGLFLIMLGVVSHSTRRAGRRERLVMDRANTKK